jgi:TIR domain
MAEESYVPGYEDDVFISYARVNNDDYDNWVDSFNQKFAPLLQNALLGRTPKIWRDISNIRRGEAWSPLIRAGAERAAVLIALLSRAYLSREWCRKEIDYFANRLSKADSLWVGVRSRIVPIWLEDLTASSDKVWPLVRMQDVDKRADPFKFYTVGAAGNSFRWIHDGDDRQLYQQEMVRLADHVASILVNLYKEAEKDGDFALRVRQQIHYPERPVLFLAPVAEPPAEQDSGADITKLRNNIKTRLIEEQINVVEADWLTSADARWEDAVEAALAQSQASLQLLGSTTSAASADGRPLAQRVFELAAETGEQRNQNKPLYRLVWLSGSVAQLNEPSAYRDFLAALSEKQDTTQAFEVIRCDTRTLVEEIAKRLNQNSPSSTEEIDVEVYVAHLQRDRGHAERLAASLKRLGVRRVPRPAIPDKPLRSELNVHYARLNSCNGLLVVYSGDIAWLWTQNIDQINKLLEKHRALHLKQQAVYDAPPTKLLRPSGVDDPKWKVILPQEKERADSDPDPNLLKDYVNALRSAMGVMSKT